MQADQSLRLFGAIEVTDGAGRVLDLGTRKQRALLAMLALEPGRVVSLDRLIDELWAGEPPAQATRTLQAYVAHLRKVLEPDRAPRTPPRILLTREPGYLLAVAPAQVDLGRFAAWADEGRQALARGEHRAAGEVLDRALALWRGKPLGEFADEGFARPVVSQLADVRAAALEDRFAARLALGEAAASVPGLEALVTEQPYREGAWALLVRALYAAGRQADALAALRRVRARLADDLGLRPGLRLRQLEQAVFDQAAELEPPAAGSVPAAEPVPAAESVPSAPSLPAAAGSRAAHADVLVAREDELAQVEARVAAVRRGQGGVLLLAGEAGVGKTRLAEEAAELAAARGFRVARGGCVDGTAPAFWPWTQVLRATGDAALLAGAVPVPDGDPDAALYALYETVVAALTAGGEPLLILLDDLHWADVSSLRLLAFVADAVARHPVLVLATLRPEPGDHPRQLRDTLGALTRQPGTRRVELGPLTAGQLAAYLRARGVAEEPELIASLLERTGGNPFYLGEVLRLRESERGRPDAVPPGARDVIERRVARLPEETGRLLRAVAVAGQEADVALLAQVTGQSAEDVMAGLEPAVATGLLTEPPSGPDYRFPHALARDAIYAGLTRLERSRLHLAVGRAWEPVLPAAESATLARHFARAADVGGAAKAAEHAARAARHATAQLAFTEAVEFWELALSALPPGDDAARSRVLTGLGQARRAVGGATAADRDLDEAFDLARRAGDQDAVIAVLAAFGGLTLWNWRPFGVVEQDVVAAIEELLAGPLDDRDRAGLLGTLGVELYYGPRRAEGEQHAAEAVRLARELGETQLRARTLNNYLLASFVPGRNAQRLRAAEEMAALPRLPRASELIARIFRMSCLLRAGDLPEWDRELAHCRQLLGDRPHPELESVIRVAQTARATLDGRWQDAEELVGAHAGMRFAATPWGARYRTHVTTFTCRRGAGRIAEYLDELVAAARDEDLRPLRPVAVLAAAEAGRPQLAHELIDRWGTETGDNWTTDFTLPVWALVAARLGTPEPQALYDRLAPYADQLIVAGMGTAAWGSTHHVLAELAHRLRQPQRARQHAEAALETHRRLGLAYWTRTTQRLLTALDHPGDAA